MATAYSNSTGNTPQAGVSINDSRRIFNFGQRVSELAPQQSPFFVYLSKVAKSATDDPVFKFLEQRHQWQRRNFSTKDWDTKTSGGKSSGDTISALHVVCDYDKYGNAVTSAAPQFLIVGQVVRIGGKALRVTAVNAVGDGTARTYASGTATSFTSVDVKCLEDIAAATGGSHQAQVIGSAWGEGTNDPEGWKDELYDREGYCQIFKTAIQLFSGTSLATRYRGRPDEYRRVWADKLMEHKMDIEHAMLFGIGSANEGGSGPLRYTHGIVPYTEANGKVFNFTYADSVYGDFIDAMQEFFAPESGNSGDKLVLTSRKIIAWLNKLDADSFLGNTLTTASYRLDAQNIKGAFGHEVTKVNTIFGNLHFVPEPLFRGQDEDLAIAVDMANVKYRPLSGNGVSRDTHIVTNVQNNNVDGRKDMVLTEAGLEISLPETHAVMKWS